MNIQNSGRRKEADGTATILVVTIVATLPTFWGHWGPLVAWGILIIGLALAGIEKAIKEKKGAVPRSTRTEPQEARDGTRDEPGPAQQDAPKSNDPSTEQDPTAR